MIVTIREILRVEFIRETDNGYKFIVFKCLRDDSSIACTTLLKWIELGKEYYNLEFKYSEVLKKGNFVTNKYLVHCIEKEKSNW